MLGYTVVDSPSVIATHLTETIKKYAHELTGRQEVQTLLDNVKENYPVIVEELIPKLMTVGEIQKGSGQPSERRCIHKGYGDYTGDPGRLCACDQ